MGVLCLVAWCAVLYLLVFHAYINEMHGSRSKIPSKKKLVRQRCAERCNSGIKGLMAVMCGSDGWRGIVGGSGLSVTCHRTGRDRAHTGAVVFAYL
jgi:hypothetical protein